MSEIEDPSQKVVASGSQPHDHEIVSRLTESTEKLLKNVLHETEAIKLNTEQISKDLKSALEKCKVRAILLKCLVLLSVVFYRIAFLKYFVKGTGKQLHWNNY